MDKIEEAAKSLNKSMKGLGTDENRLIKEIISHSNAQRQLIKDKYMTFYGKKLEEDIKSEISGNFLEGVLALLEQTEDYDAKLVHDAIKGIGTNQKLLIQVLCPKEADEIQVLKATFKKLYQKDLEKEMANEEGGHLGRIFRSIVSGGRADRRTDVDKALAKKEAQELYDAGEGKFGTDESEFIRVLCSRSFPQLNETFEEYKKISKNDIEVAVKKEMSGYLEKACLAIIKSARNKTTFFAEQIYEAMVGLGTRNDELIRLLVLRSEKDLPQIKQEYFRLYNKKLYDVVKSEISGDYEKLFLSLIGQ